MKQTTLRAVLLALAALGLPGRQAGAQAALADDIIAASAGGAGRPATQLSREGLAPLRFGRVPGSQSILFGDLTPGQPLGGYRPKAVLPSLHAREGQAAERRALPLPRWAQLAERFLPPEPEGLLLPPVEHAAEERPAGPPTGMTLDEAVARLVELHPSLQAKKLEIPIADADALTAGLRDNPLFFASASEIPYGTYRDDKPGSIDYSISLVWPVDVTRKRQARSALARFTRKVAAAEYDEEVRQHTNHLYGLWVDVLEAQHRLRSAALGVEDLQATLDWLRAGGIGDEEVRPLVIELEMARLLVKVEQGNLQRARESLAELLLLPPREACCFAVQGSLQVEAPRLPPLDELVALALRERPDLASARLQVERAVAEVELAESEWLATPFILLTPFTYLQTPAQGEADTVAWSAGLFLPLPLFNRNQGNIRHAKLDVQQAYLQASALERQVRLEVRRAVEALQQSGEDLRQLDAQILPLVREELALANRRFADRQISMEAHLRAHRDFSSVVRLQGALLGRHRHDMLLLDTALGVRLLP